MRVVLVGAVVTACLLAGGLGGCTSPDPTTHRTTRVTRVTRTPPDADVTPSLAPSGTTTAARVEEVVRAGDRGFAVGRTASGGPALWRLGPDGRLSPRAPVPRSGAGLRAIAFDSPRTGLALTGARGRRRQTWVWATTDGARTWSAVRLPTTQPSVAVSADAGGAFVLTTGCRRPRVRCDHVAVWSVDPTGRVRPRTFDSLPRARPGDTHADAQTALASWADRVWVLVGNGGGRSTGFTSADGGRTWHRFTPGVCLSQRLVATSATTLWSTCTTGLLEHFTRQRVGSPPVRVFPGDLGGTSGSALLPLTDATAYAVLASGSRRPGLGLLVTTDGGRTVRMIGDLPGRLARTQPRLTFVSPSTGYLVTDDGGLDRSTDAGRTWRPVGAGWWPRRPARRPTGRPSPSSRSSRRPRSPRRRHGADLTPT